MATAQDIQNSEKLLDLSNQLTDSINERKKLLKGINAEEQLFFATVKQQQKLSQDITANAEKYLGYQIKSKDLTKQIKDEVLLNHYDLGIHSNKANKKYDMFRICKLVCNELNSIELENDDIWENLDNQLTLEYPFNIDSYKVLPSDYHITNFFNIQKSNTNKITKKWLKTPRDIADFLEASISADAISPTAMQVDAEHSFQIAK